MAEPRSVNASGRSTPAVKESHMSQPRSPVEAEQGQVSQKPDPSKSTASESAALSCVGALAVIFLLTTIIFAALYSYQLSVNASDQDASSTETAMDKSDMCNTPDCVTTAASMVKMMNLSADPCEDFNEYACGRFNREAAIPHGAYTIGPTSILSGSNRGFINEVIQAPVLPNEPKYLSNMKRFFQSCINDEKIEEVGLKPFLNETAYISHWPTLNKDWKETDFNLNNLLETFAKVNVQPLFQIQLGEDKMDSSKKALLLSDPKLLLPVQYLTGDRNSQEVFIHEKTLAEVAFILGVDRTIADQDAKGVVDLEFRVAKIMVPQEMRRDQKEMYNPITMKQLQHDYTDFDIPRTIRALFSSVGVTFPDSEIVINKFPTYLSLLSQVVQETPKRDMANLFGFHFANERISLLTARLQEIRFGFSEINIRTAGPGDRTSSCLTDTTQIFAIPLSREFVKRSFSESSKSYMKTMVDNLLAEFKDMIKTNSWMSQATKDEALKKLNTYKQKIGYPDVGFEVADLEKNYEKYVMQEDNYYANRMLVSKLMKEEALGKFRIPVDRDSWGMATYAVNAYYSAANNEIVFPAGILQPPYFSEKSQDSLNYGAIGSIIGHEITHGFDDKGSQYDEKGNLRNWWTQEDRANFMSKMKCIVAQYGDFRVVEINKNISGINTQAEDVADSDGLRAAFRAYKRVAANKQVLNMPGLNLSQDQLLFLAFAQNWCENSMLIYINYQTTTSDHPMGRFRIIGALQNSEDFAKAYNCPSGSKMNPAKKCTVW